MRKIDEQRINVILNTVSGYFRVPNDEILHGDRSGEYVAPRHMLRYLVKDELGIGWSEVARMIGGDHATIYASVKKVENLLEVDKYYQECYKDLLTLLRINKTNIEARKKYYDIRRKIRGRNPRSHQRTRVSSWS